MNLGYDTSASRQVQRLKAVNILQHSKYECRGFWILVWGKLYDDVLFANVLSSTDLLSSLAPLSESNMARNSQNVTQDDVS